MLIKVFEHKAGEITKNKKWVRNEKFIKKILSDIKSGVPQL